MIYRYYDKKNVYYAGINYGSRLSDIRRVHTLNYHGREDAWTYSDLKGVDHLIYRGVNITKGVYTPWTIRVRADYWKWFNKSNKWQKDSYPDDL